MNKTYLIFRQELRATLRRKTYVIVAFGLPLVIGIFVVLFTRAENGAAAAATAVDAPTVPVGYVDPGGYVTQLPPELPPDLLLAYPDRTSAQAALEAGAIDGYYVIAADYLTSGAIEAVTDWFNPLEDGFSADIIIWVLDVNLLEGDAARAALLRRPLTTSYTQLGAAAAAADNPFVELFPMLMTLMIYMVILMPASILVTAMIDEKKNRVLEVVLSTVSPLQLVTGKVIALGLLGLAQTAVWFGTVWAVVTFGRTGLALPESFTVPPELVFGSIAFFLLGYAMYGVLMAGIGALADDIKDTKGVTFLVMTPIILAYLLMIVVMDQPNGTIATAVSLFPLTGPVGMVTRLSVTTVPWWQLLTAGALQLATAIVLIRLVARLFRAQQLLSGQPFNVGRYLGALRPTRQPA